MEFLKILWNNLRKGPVTDPFPHDETFTPDHLRGRVEIDPALCVGCGTCKHVCVAGAIEITKLEDASAFEVTVWHNTCCRCAQCRHFCPTHAITLSSNWHNAHRNSEKYTQVTRAHVPYDACANCGMKIRFLPPAVLERIYAGHPEINVEEIARLCPECRRIETAVQEDRACHIDHLQKLADKEEACLLPSKTFLPPKANEAPEPSAATESVSKEAFFIPASADVSKGAPEPTRPETTLAVGMSINELPEPDLSIPAAVTLKRAEEIPAITERTESALPSITSVIPDPIPEQEKTPEVASPPIVLPAAPVVAGKKTPAKKKKKAAPGGAALKTAPVPNDGKAQKTTSKNAASPPKKAKAPKA